MTGADPETPSGSAGASIPVVLRFAISRADVAAALVRGRPTPSVRSSLLWATAIVTVGFVIRTNDAPTWMVTTCFALGAALVGLALYLPIRSSWHWRQNRRLFETCELRADESGLVVTEPRAEARAAWSAFVRWEETPDLFLLYRAPSYSVLIPKRAFDSAADLVTFRGLVSAGVGGTDARDPVESPPS